MLIVLAVLAQPSGWVLAQQDQMGEAGGMGGAGEAHAASSASAVPASRQANNVAIITIRGPIDRITALSIRRRMKIAEDAGADAIVFDLDTPGGELGAVLDISNMIKASPIQNTVAWINPNAYSGGAIIALACREIVTNDPATMGDALIIAISFGMLNTLPEAERQKMLSPLMAEVVDSARRRGWDEYLVQAFVTRGVELWYVQNKATGQRICVDRAEYEILFGVEPPLGVPRLTSAKAGKETSAPVTADSTGQSPPAADTDFKPASPGLNAIAEQVSGAQELRSTRPVISEDQLDQWTYLERVTDGAGPIVLKSADLKHYGFSSAIITDDTQLSDYFAASNVRRIDRSWSETLARMMSNIVVRGLLIVVFLIALFVEMSSPGVALPGSIAAIALIALLAPPMLTNMASWWEIIAIAIGIALLFLEVFVLPGFGVFGVAGLVLLFGGLIFTFVPEPSQGMFPDSPGATRDLFNGTATVVLALATSGVGMYFISKYFGSIPLLGNLVLKETTGDFDLQSDMLSAMEPEEGHSLSIGDLGKTTTELRPVGKAMFDGSLVLVKAAFGFINAGVAIRVSDIGDLGQPIVEPCEDKSAAMQEGEDA